MNERYRIWKTINAKYNIRMREATNQDMEDDAYWDYIDEMKANGFDYSDYIFDDGTASLILLEKSVNHRNKVKKVLESEYEIKHNKGGRKPKISMDDKIIATVKYLDGLGEISYTELARQYEIHESNIIATINWVKEMLQKHNLLIETKCEIKKGKLDTVYFLNIKKIDKIK